MAHYTIIIFIALLLISSAVAMVTRWVRIPYTVALVIVGLIIGPLHLLPPVNISPELILLIFLPALLFEGAWNLKFEALRANAAPILILATVGVFISVGIIGTIIHFGVGLSWNSSLLFGAIISATDPVSVLAVFRKLGAPERLKVIIEGESLFNDGTAAVVFRIVLGIVAGTTATGSATGLIGHALLDFLFEVVGGLVLGIAIGLVVSKLTSYFDDHLLEISLSALAAYGSFLLADYLHVSPVIATIAAGLVIGNYGWQVVMWELTQVAADFFCASAAFLFNSLVFLLIGL
jgi:CPA1 family monovalent cation:H+ antiporter